MKIGWLQTKPSKACNLLFFSFHHSLLHSFLSAFTFTHAPKDPSVISNSYITNTSSKVISISLFTKYESIISVR